MTSLPGAFKIRPSSSPCLTTSFATASSSTTPSISPRPRTWATPGTCEAALISSCPLRRTSARKASSTTPSTAFAAAQATGLPPKVVPCDPGVKSVAALPRAMVAPMGSPPPNPFAMVITSGAMPSCWKAKKSPVRPTPVCTSSVMKRIPWASQSSRTFVRKPSGAGMTPVSPWMGSRMIAAVLPGSCCTSASSASMSP